MSNNITPNGVKITFNNNHIMGIPEGCPPFFVFDKDGNLTEVNFDGYFITRREYKKDETPSMVDLEV